MKNKLTAIAAANLMLLTLVRGPNADAETTVLQRGYDAGLSGATLSETTLNTSNVGPSTFGLVFKLPVDDAIFAQPLYVPNVPINQTAHNVLYVATMSDTVYAFDADAGGAPLWKLNLASLVNATPVPIAKIAGGISPYFSTSVATLSTSSRSRSVPLICTVIMSPRPLL